MAELPEDKPTGSSVFFLPDDSKRKAMKRTLLKFPL